MTGFASLSWEEWQSKTKVATRRQRKECLSWMNELWEKTHFKDWPKEWEHLQKAVRQETLWDAFNVSEAEHKKQAMPMQGFLVRSKDPIEWAHQSWVESTVFSRESEKTRIWLQLMSQWVDWRRFHNIPKALFSKDRGQVVVGHDCSVWLTHAMQSDWTTDEIQTVWGLAEKQGWSVKEIPEDAWPRLWFLNSVSDAPKFDGAWLFEKVEQDDSGRLCKKFFERVERESGDCVLKLSEDNNGNYSPFISVVRWSVADSMGIEEGLRFWAERAHLLSGEEVDAALIFFKTHVSKREEPLSSGVVRGWNHLVSSLERVKLESKVAIPIDHVSPLKAL